MSYRTYIISSRIRPDRSLLGRWIRAYSVDARQAESTYVVAVVASSLVLLLLHLLGWSIVRSMDARIAVFTVVEIAVLVAFSAAAFAGRDPAITVCTGSTALTISRGGDHELTLPFSELDSASRIDARTFHRHYRRYAETRSFVNRVPTELVLLRWKGIPVILGLEEEDLDAFLPMLEQRVSAVRASSHVGAA